MKVFAEDLKLATAAAGGDAAAQERIYHDYHKLVTALVGKTLKYSDDTEDIAQEVFIQIFTKLHLYKGDAALKSWIYRVTFNRCLMRFRERSFRNARQTFAGEDVFRAMIAPSSAQPIERLMFERAFDNLAPGYKKVLYLSDVLGFSHEEAAEILNLHEGTIKSQLFKARHKMRALIDGKSRAKSGRVPKSIQLAAVSNL